MIDDLPPFRVSGRCQQIPTWDIAHEQPKPFIRLIEKSCITFRYFPYIIGRLRVATITMHKMGG